MENKAFVVDKPNYGATMTSSGEKIKRSVTYCVHGKVAADCCESMAVTIKTDAHCHKMSTHQEGIDKVARRKLLIASGLCVIFMIAEIVGGALSNSLAIGTDAAHLLADLASFMISLLAIYIASRRRTKRMSFGFHRAEVIGALCSVLLIWVVTAILVYLAILRTQNLDFEINSEIMLISSALGIVVNIIMGCALHGHGHGHGGGGHGHSHEDPRNKHDGHEESGITHSHAHDNMNVRAALIHVISDFVQSCGVFVAALVIYIEPTWKIIDPICTFVFSILVLITTINILKDAILVLMEGTPEYMDYKEVLATFLNISGVKRVHNLRIWALSTNKVALAAHLAVEPNTNTEAVLREATLKIHAKYDFYETTLQIELYDDEMESCKDCTNPE